MEFAIVAPLLFALLLGIMEFGWTFYQHLDVRHGAREGVRLAAVNYEATDACLPGGSTTCNNTQRDKILAATCDRMAPGSNRTVSIERSDQDGNGQDYNVGDSVILTVEKDPVDQITGFYNPILGSITLSSRVEMRLEQPAKFSVTAAPVGCAP